MERNILIILLLSSLFFTGCLRTYYPIHYALTQSPLIFEPNDKDSLISKYISAELTVADGFNKDESIYILQGFFSIAATSEHTNSNVELFASAGNYKVSGVSAKFDGNKSEFGLGASIKFAVNFKIKDSKLGLGLSYAYRKEFGNILL